MATRALLLDGVGEGERRAQRAAELGPVDGTQRGRSSKGTLEISKRVKRAQFPEGPFVRQQLRYLQNIVQTPLSPVHFSLVASGPCSGMGVL